LGLGDTTDKLSPVKFTGVSNIKKFGVGYLVSYAITEDGKYYAWGGGGNYARGDNTTGNISYPKHIDSLPNILAPSFDFDGYDKISSYDTEILRKVSFQSFTYSGLTCNEMQTLTHYNGAWNAWLWEFVEGGGDDPYPSASYDRPNGTRGQAKEWYKSKNDWRILRTSNGYKLEKLSGGTWESPSGYHVQTADTFQPDADGIVTITFNWNSHTGVMFKEPLYKNGVDFSTKFTKGTTTYDAGKATIITVPDPATYDAQLNKGDFSLKSATVPATSSSGLYTWAFHHGNFDNAYGDGDILTARDNGRFYADTPAYTSASIGTITPSGTPSSFVYEFFISVLVGSSGSNNELWLQEISSSGFSLTASMMVMNTQYRVNGIDYNAGTSVVSGLFDGSTGTSNRVGVYPGYHDLNQKIFTLTTSQELTNITLTSQRPMYMPGWKIVLNGTTILEDSANNGTSGSPEPFTITKPLPVNANTTYTFTPASTLTANVLMVAGGGGGGGHMAGGGGAGGLVYTAGTSLANGSTKTIVVGNGGQGSDRSTNNGYNVGSNGNDTSFTGLTTSVGGGNGGGYLDNVNNFNGSIGGSGGGGGHGTSGAAGTLNQGYAGGDSQGNHTGGGGGGAGGVGETPSSNSVASGKGGIGSNQSSVFGTFYGESGFFAGGGGGGQRSSTGQAAGAGGLGGGGGGSNSGSSSGIAISGSIHTGGGGGGGADGGSGRGGSGIVLLQTNVSTPRVNSEVKIPEPHYHVLIEKPDDTHFSHLPNGTGNGGVHTGGSIVPNIPRADGSVSNVYYASSYAYFYAAQAGSLVSTVEGIFYPIEQQRYDNILEIGHNSTHDVELEMASDGTAKLYRNQGGTHLASGTVKCFTVGKWHHVVLTLDANRNAVAYVNGYPVVSTTYASAILPGSRTQNCIYRTGVNATFRKFLMYYFKTYNSVLNQNQILKLASSVGLGPKLEYDSLNTIKILNTEPGSSVKLFTSNVADTSNVFIVADPAAGEYTVPEAGKYYAEIKGTDTFTITRTIDADEPLYQYPPVVTGTKSSLTTSLSADTWNTWTMSGASTGNGQYQAKTSHATVAPGGTHAAAAGVFTNGVKIEIISDGGASIYSFLQTNQLTNFDITLQLPSAKIIRKYVLYPADTNAPVSTPGGSVDPILPGNGGEENTRRAKSWVLKGSNDATSWTTIHTVANKPPSIYGDVHTVSSPASYQYYQISISANNGSSQSLSLGEWQLWGDA